MEPQNLENLTEKIYQEGIARAEAEAQQILEKAEKEKTALIESAQSEADSIINAARVEAENIRRNVESELKLKGNQAVSDLKARIRDILSSKILDEPVRNMANDEEFLRKLILEIATHWKKNDLIELHLPAELGEKLSNNFTAKIEKELHGLSIEFDNSMKSGFRIGRKEDAYEISFTGDDFLTFFRSYLDDQTNRILFSS